jgi:hypothetical protein
MAILSTDIRILFTNYDIIAYFVNLASCSEHFISIKHRILATFNMIILFYLCILNSNHISIFVSLQTFWTYFTAIYGLTLLLNIIFHNKLFLKIS